ncbi:O-methylsterigmatocystin oxidoreductase [Aspergillus arachidicola]|uniref:O-methylsterigmatocystin oxidoreductase n=1 Tax=Aspergillus arachidicola TaxID=656916 RepID=A0A2G7FF22_9EURO|nr:O-methylsterigmatocystin oxidoreductase [Aspergillus arachidicola]
MPFMVLGLAIGVIFLYFLRSFLARTKSFAPLPPGPRPKPIIGNLWDLPPQGTRDWLHWLKHKDLYGPISSVTAFGQTIIILNEVRLAYELLEKRSAIHSSRPSCTFAHMAGYGDITTVLEYSDRLRTTRKIAHQQIGSNKAISRFSHIQDAEVCRYLLRMLRDPGNWLEHVKKETGAVILKITYGYTIEPHERDPLVDLADDAVGKFSLAMVPGAWLVDSIPILKHLPSWAPGGGCTRAAEGFQTAARNLGSVPYAFTKQQMAQGSNVPSIISYYLESENIQPDSEEEHLVKWATATLYGGGADTTVSTMMCFFLTMALYPHVQRKAQEEIDRVVGVTHLPGFEDRESLPYIDALLKEALRWHPVVPMGVAHMAMENDMLEGYHIPKGAAILSNIWAFTHDPNEYHDPMTFKPERFLSDNGHTPERDPHLISFGFGRRICPGRNLADSNLWLAIARTLAVFNIAKPIRDGKEVDIQPEFQASLISHPDPFDVDIKPRSAAHHELILAGEKQYPWEESHAEELRRAIAVP